MWYILSHPGGTHRFTWVNKFHLFIFALLVSFVGYDDFPFTGSLSSKDVLWFDCKKLRLIVKTIWLSIGTIFSSYKDNLVFRINIYITNKNANIKLMVYQVI